MDWVIERYSYDKNQISALNNSGGVDMQLTKQQQQPSQAELPAAAAATPHLLKPYTCFFGRKSRPTPLSVGCGLDYRPCEIFWV